MTILTELVIDVGYLHRAGEILIMKDRCNKTDRRGFAARLLRGVIRTCFLISPIIIAQTALGQTQNIFYPEQITVTAGNNAIREIPDNVVWLTGG